MLRWTLMFLTVATIIGILVFTGLYSSGVFGDIAKIYTTFTVVVCALMIIWGLTTKFKTSDDLDDWWEADERTEHLTAKLAKANMRSQFWEGKFRTIKLENNALRNYNYKLGEDLGEASNRLAADVINQAADDQKRYEAEIAELKDLNRLLQHADPKPAGREITV